jgi:hypothetical protein
LFFTFTSSSLKSKSSLFFTSSNLKDPRHHRRTLQSADKLKDVRQFTACRLRQFDMDQYMWIFDAASKPSRCAACLPAQRGKPG